MKHFSREKYDKYNKSISSKKSMQIVYYLCLIGIFSCLLLLFSVKTFVNREVNALKYKVEIKSFHKTFAFASFPFFSMKFPPTKPVYYCSGRM